MAQSLAKNLIHLVFSTKLRTPILPFEGYEPLWRYTTGILESQQCHLIEMNNVADHVHILFDLHRTQALSTVVMHVKKGSSRWIKGQSPQFNDFEWQSGFGAFSLGLSQRDDVRAYIRRQQSHHAAVSFQDEFREFLRRYEIDYDEHYVWD